MLQVKCFIEMPKVSAVYQTHSNCIENPNIVISEIAVTVILTDLSMYWVTYKHYKLLNFHLIYELRVISNSWTLKFNNIF